MWMTNLTMEIKLLDNTTDIILLAPTSNIPDMETPCLFAGKIKGDPESVVAVSGCFGGNETSLSISSSLLPGGLLFVTLVGDVTYSVDADIEAHFNGFKNDVVYAPGRKRRHIQYNSSAQREDFPSQLLGKLR